MRISKFFNITNRFLFFFLLQLLRGCSDNDLKKYNLKRDPLKYNYTNQGINEILSEAHDYKATMSAFRTLGFSPDEIISTWQIVAAILHLGNITFDCKWKIVCFFLKNQKKED